MVKTATVTVQIQFDIYDGDEKEQVISTLHNINKLLQSQMDDISPIIFTNGIDSSDIDIDEDDE